MSRDTFTCYYVSMCVYEMTGMRGHVLVWLLTLQMCAGQDPDFIVIDLTVIVPFPTHTHTHTHTHIHTRAARLR